MQQEIDMNLHSFARRAAQIFTSVTRFKATTARTCNEAVKLGAVTCNAGRARNQ
jgi:hypothetical protein